jgi:exopolyphosphatase/guanosine-5'-triphosphate,3'-diphosphate pyrophosphatase
LNVTESAQRIGLIDIGSNTIRLVIMEELEHSHAHRLLEESKETIRLAARMNADGSLPLSELDELVQILNHFRRLCELQQTSIIRAVATAAIRNATNQQAIVDALRVRSGLPIEILSGDDEARAGFLGVINTMDVESGFVIDIGGGSTEITYFTDRAVRNDISIPIGAVNAAKFWSVDGVMSAAQIRALERELDKHLTKHRWVGTHPGLTLVGLGGTCRTAGKMDQAQRSYSFPVIHHYEMEPQIIAEQAALLASLPLDERKKIGNLGKDRIDIIAPGLVILQHIIGKIKPQRIIISGSGLRDGIFFQTVIPDRPVIHSLLTNSVESLLAHYPPSNIAHETQVKKIAGILFDALAAEAHERLRTLLEIAAMVYQIGVNINYYQFHKHTFYLLTNSRIDGLSHREILLVALIAAHRSKNRTRELYNLHKDILSEDDFQTAVQLGAILELATALDRSKTQPLQHLQVTLNHEIREMHLSLTYHGDFSLETRALEGQTKEFKKMWNIRVRVTSVQQPETLN